MLFLVEKGTFTYFFSSTFKYFLLLYSIRKIQVQGYTRSSIVGNIKKVPMPQELTSQLNAQPAELVEKFYRLIISSVIFYSKQYTRVCKRNSFTISYTVPNNSTGPRFAQIQYFIRLKDHIYAVIKELNCIAGSVGSFFNLSTDALDNNKKILSVVEVDDDISLLNINCIKNKCMFLVIEDNCFIGQFPNDITHD